LLYKIKHNAYTQLTCAALLIGCVLYNTFNSILGKVLRYINKTNKVLIVLLFICYTQFSYNMFIVFVSCTVNLKRILLRVIIINSYNIYNMYPIIKLEHMVH